MGKSIVLVRDGKQYGDWKRKAFDGEASKDVVIQSKMYVADTITSEGDRRLAFTVSTSVIDRDKDVVKAEGWIFDDYRKNPVVLFGHDASMPPVAQAETIGIQAGRVKSRALFATKEMYEFADTIYQLSLNKFLRAVSPGFTPVDFEVDKSRGGVNFNKQTLLEWSIVPIPSNPEALQEAKQMGIDLSPMKKWAERTLDEISDEPGLWLPRSMVEKAMKIVDPKTSVSVSAPPPSGGSSSGGHAGAGAGSDAVTVKGSADFLATMKPLIEKLGRVLSAKNESKLREAVTALEEVLEQIESGDVEKPITLSFAADTEKGSASAVVPGKEDVVEGKDGDADDDGADDDDVARLAKALTVSKELIGALLGQPIVEEELKSSLTAALDAIGILLEQVAPPEEPPTPGNKPPEKPVMLSFDDSVVKAMAALAEQKLVLPDGMSVAELSRTIEDAVQRERMKVTGQLPG